MNELRRERLPGDVCVRRKSDGRFLWTRFGNVLVSETPKFLPSRGRAALSVRCDMGLDLDDVELVARGELAAVASPPRPASAAQTARPR
jgi:hypothetical protein